MAAHVECIYPLLAKQRRVFIEYQTHMTVAQAWQQSGLASIAPSNHKLAVFDKIVEPDYKLEPGDKIHLVRELQIDPKQARRKRAKNLARKS